MHNLAHLKALRRKLRNDATPAEAELWRFLNKSQLGGRKFRRQHSISPYIADFYCPAEKLVVGLDGAPHNDPIRHEYDSERAAFLQQHGIRIVRFENRDVFEDIETVLQAISWHFQ